MCGIFGWKLTHVSDKAKVAGSMLAFQNDSRGGDSWGYSNGLEVTKGLRNCAPVAHEMVRNKVLFGHTRKATTGTVSVGNAHPFEIGDIVGAHNGIIYNHAELNKQYQRNFPVDSMHIFGHLAEGKQLKDIEGYGAIWYYDRKNPDELFLIRFEQGDLSVARAPKVGVFFSSSEHHLRSSLEAAGVKHTIYQQLEAGRVYRISYDSRTKEDILWRTEDTNPIDSYHRSYYQRDFGGFGTGGYGHGRQLPQTTKTTPETGQVKNLEALLEALTQAERVEFRQALIDAGYDIDAIVPNMVGLNKTEGVIYE